MKKLDRLVLKAFIGPFILTVMVVTFIFLTQTILKYIDELVGKGLGFMDYAELMFYFSMNILPVAFPLAILLSSLITFGNLGQFNELTAVKSSGITLLRVLLPIFIWVIGCTIGLYWFNDVVVPKANLKAYSLLYDLRQKKPSLDLKPGVFYNGIPGYSIKISQKFDNDSSLKDIMIYDHTKGRGNTDVILADSGSMYLMNDNQYLVLELFKGRSFSEYQGDHKHFSILHPQEFIRNRFYKTKIVFDLSSFDLKRTKEELFAGSRHMKNRKELNEGIDSLKKLYNQNQQNTELWLQPFYNLVKIQEDSLVQITRDRALQYTIASDSLDYSKAKPGLIRGHAQRAANQVRSIRNYLQGNIEREDYLRKEINMFEVSKYQKMTQSMACLVLFLIGAPLGAIIKKGGLGVPVLIAILFFIFYYVFGLTGEKWSKEGVMPTAIAMWFGNLMLLPVGLFFLRQAKNDSRILESDIYLIWWDKLRGNFIKKKG
ncbi:MAG: LptF/LptG family permease [Cytophagaceae bacterium]|nr:LptF/LptG family permease [Cytophagaceae bacterium]